MAECLNRDDAEGKNVALAFEEPGERLADVSVSDECETQLELHLLNERIEFRF
jgi:hypothetical protein